MERLLLMPPETSSVDRQAPVNTVRLGEGYVWPVDDLEVAWSRRHRDLSAIEKIAAVMPSGPHRDLIFAFLGHRRGEVEQALEMVQGLLDDDPFDPLWRCRLVKLHGGLLHDLGLASQALEVRERAVLLAQETGNPIAVISTLHDRGTSVERLDGRRAQLIFMTAIDLIAGVTDAPPHAQDELLALRGLLIVNLHLLSQRTGLPLPAGCPDLAETGDRIRTVWPTLSAVIRALCGLQLLDAGDENAARRIFTGLPDPLAMRDGDHAVVVAAGVSALLSLDGRYDEAISMLDSMAASAPAQYRHEILDSKASVYEHAGDFERAYRVSRELNQSITRLYGDEARATVRALEVFYRTDAHRAAAESARRQSEVVSALAEQWRRSSFQDPLTEVWNRRYLERRMEELAGTVGHQVAVIDLDGFKRVNDLHGHEAGDLALRHVAQVLERAALADDVCVRYGGDEFCILRTADTEGSLAEDLVAVREPGPRVDGVGSVTLSIGVATVGRDGFTEAFRRADAAMYRAKRSGGGTVRF